ncbi:FAD-dependent monooxygenase [Actinokineospora inagensis]|uniref:FAD-dependent monooxygenase n=1 Tax=Actinokineospora inagensis TaxID=103730 RepID=UPI000479DEA1|nr:FAD-dependent monooxygenase [Actinokineospora inagensis]
MTEHAVVISGGGPTGLMLAAELTLAGVDVVVVERRTSQDLVGSRAGGLHARSIEVLDQRGIVDRFLAEGRTAQVAGFGGVRLDISDFPSRHNYGLALWQKHFERILGGWVEELGVRVLRGTEVAGLTQDGAGVDVELAGGRPLRAEYLVGCDGSRSPVRRAAGIGFTGVDPTRSWLIAEVELTEEPVDWAARHTAAGINGMSKLDDGRIRVLISEDTLGPATDPTIDDLRAALIDVWGTDYGVHSHGWLSRFTDATRQATAYRAGRVLLAGDAAHVHAPIGGQGLNLGLQDAVNLGWKLAQVVTRTSPEGLLDTYHAERHPVAAHVLRTTLAQSALRGTDDRTKALTESIAEVLAFDEPRRYLGGVMSGLGLRYDLGAGHPLLGRRMPDLDLTTADGPLRVYELLHQARPVLLTFDEPVDVPSSRVRVVEAEYNGIWELPVLGVVDAPTAVLVRPDGYVAWVGTGTREGLPDALSTWFGA